MNEENKKVFFADEAETELDYFGKGISEILENSNPGLVSAFSNKVSNQKGIYHKADDFYNFLDDYEINLHSKNLPEEFFIKIKYSPISLFKMWIFKITNRELLKVSERDKEFSKEFFMFKDKKDWRFVPLISNVAHEKLLYILYKDAHYTDEFISNFTIDPPPQKKLVIYRDYASDKEHFVLIKKSLVPGRPVNIKIKIIRTKSDITYLIKVDNAKIQKKVLKIPGSKKKKTVEIENHPIPVPSSSSGKKTLLKKAERASRKNKSKRDRATVMIEGSPAGGTQNDSVDTGNPRHEVLGIIKSVEGKTFRTNNSANIALGRVSKTSILVNLPVKYKNQDFKVALTENQRLLIKDLSGSIVKTFQIVKNPKSNWLKKVK